MSDTPRLYVGTYAKYNNGSIEGAWLDLDDYADKDAFLEAARALHADEADPELMYQDFEGFPREMYCESSVSDELFEWVHMDDDDKALLAVYLEHVDQEGTLEQAREAYCGTYKNPEDWAFETLEGDGSLNALPESLRRHFDYESYARECGMDGMCFAEVSHGECWVFYNR
jgi:antirestriction protein